jgi:pimeloyl-ACP methyl ester carboxylesterase
MTDITIVNGQTRLAASVYGPPAAPPILFLHGISLSRDTWDEIAQRLSPSYRIWTLDFRGHGHSDRTSRYELADYVSDAEAALAAIGRPAVVVGHSLGGCVAGVLAQTPHPAVSAVFLEDPPWYLGKAGEWDRTQFPKLFAIISGKQAAWQNENAPLATYQAFLANAPSPMGGIGSDHTGPRHLFSHASALQRQDNRCWENVIAASGGVLSALATDRELRRPTMIIQADPRYGGALLDDHVVLFAKANPRAEIVQYRDCGHSAHRAMAFEQRFFDDLEAFVLRHRPS